MKYIQDNYPRFESEVWSMKQDNQDLLSFIDSYFHFKEFQAKENIMEQMDSKKRQDAVDYALFENPKALKKFARNW